jgi:hypothetical protein
MPNGSRWSASWRGTAGLTREAYALDLCQFTSWCRARSLNLFAVRCADIEGFARDLEARDRAHATVTRRRRTATSVVTGPDRRAGRVSPTRHTLSPDRSGNVTARIVP